MKINNGRLKMNFIVENLFEAIIRMSFLSMTTIIIIGYGMLWIEMEFKEQIHLYWPEKNGRK